MSWATCAGAMACAGPAPRTTSWIFVISGRCSRCSMSPRFATSWTNGSMPVSWFASMVLTSAWLLLETVVAVSATRCADDSLDHGRRCLLDSLLESLHGRPPGSDPVRDQVSLIQRYGLDDHVPNITRYRRRCLPVAGASRRPVEHMHAILYGDPADRVLERLLPSFGKLGQETLKKPGQQSPLPAEFVVITLHDPAGLLLMSGVEGRDPGIDGQPAFPQDRSHDDILVEELTIGQDLANRPAEHVGTKRHHGEGCDVDDLEQRRHGDAI